MRIVLYMAAYILDIAALFYLLWLLYSNTALNIQRKKPLFIGIILTVVIILSEAGTVLAGNGFLRHRTVNIMCNVIGFAFSPVIPIIITLIFDRRILTTRRFLLFPTFINIFAAALSPFYGLIFYVDAYNHYMRGHYFFIFVAVYIINFLILFISTLEIGRKYNYPIMNKLIVLALFTILGTSIQLIYPLVYVSWHCVTLSMLLYFFLMSEFDSSFDTLTGMYNRTASEKVARHASESKPFTVIALDIDDFKVINDTYGHDFGDTIIKAVAAIVQKSFDKQFICYRFGGDEFVIISNETNKEKIDSQIKTMIRNLEEERKKGNPIPTVSYGYSIYNGKEKLDFQKILREADDQMYYYKKAYKSEKT